MSTQAKRESGWRRFACLGGVLLALTLGGCSTVSQRAEATLESIGEKTNLGQNPRDPLEGFNRKMFAFNLTLDEHVFKPAATAYQSVTPGPLQTGIGNFFGNLTDVWTAANTLLQGRVAQGANDVMRVLVNTTFGLGGVLDIATPAGLTRHREDFGQTLGVWGVRSGPYLVLPLFGASTLRDTAALPIDWRGDLWQNVKPMRARTAGTLVRVVDKRAQVLDAVNLIEEAALDQYVFVRDAYLQKRASEIRPDED